MELTNGECDENHPLAEDDGTKVGSPALMTATKMITDASQSNEKQPMSMMDDDNIMNHTTSKSSKKRQGRSAGNSVGKSIGKLGNNNEATVVDRGIDCVVD
mmetsp:Transcript_2807/g.5130  ORF Transcript_2807/g.5130 Transcript_2807/m.5130 type:complete len:101 (-) Transcript_2807:827-1129(-)